MGAAVRGAGWMATGARVQREPATERAINYAWWKQRHRALSVSSWKCIDKPPAFGDNTRNSRTTAVTEESRRVEVAREAGARLQPRLDGGPPKFPPEPPGGTP